MTRHRLRFVCAATLVLAGLCGSPAFGQEITREEFEALKKDIATLKQQFADLDKAMKRLAPDFTTAQTEVDALKEEVRILNERVQSIAGSEGDAGIPSILGNMQKSESFREEMSKVVQGKIIVNNTTGYDQFLHINGVRWRAPAGLSYTFIPYGAVQTQLNPEEPVREWTVRDWKLVDDGHQLEIGIQW